VFVVRTIGPPDFVSTLIADVFSVDDEGGCVDLLQAILKAINDNSTKTAIRFIMGPSS
jgi:hypothetical protein